MSDDFVTEFLGVTGDTGVYRLDLSASDLDTIQTIVIQDDNFISGGTGAASGFDLDFVKLSPVFESSPANVDALPSLDVFDFSEQSTLFQEGFLQPWEFGDAPEWNRDTLFGTIDDGEVNFELATLGQLDGINLGDSGSISIGEGGFIIFQLTEPVSTDDLYLYFGDIGGGNDQSLVTIIETVESEFQAGLILFGTIEDDTIELGVGANEDIGEGDDFIQGLDGDDILSGAAGDDELRGSTGSDTISGGTGDDLLGGGSDDDVIEGNRGSDRINGFRGRDLINGGGGSDRINAGRGRDIANGNAGDDRILGKRGRDVLSGNGGDDILNGNKDNDDLFGGRGNDRLVGGGGRDFLQGDAGDDRIITGGGRDTIALGANDGRDRIIDFEIGKDSIQLLGSLSVDDLTIDSQNGNTVLRLQGSAIAILVDVNADAVINNSSDIFV